MIKFILLNEHAVSLPTHFVLLQCTTSSLLPNEIEFRYVIATIHECFNKIREGLSKCMYSFINKMMFLWKCTF